MDDGRGGVNYTGILFQPPNYSSTGFLTVITRECYLSVNVLLGVCGRHAAHSQQGSMCISMCISVCISASVCSCVPSCHPIN